MSNATWMYIAFALVGLGIAGYTAYLRIWTRKLEARRRLLEEHLNR